MINKVILVGRLTKDIVVKKTESGLSVAVFTVACDKRTGKGQEKQADFISCQAWRQSADFLGTYAGKGDIVGVEGRINTSSYTDKDGRTVYVTNVVVDHVELISKNTKERAATDNGFTGIDDNNLPF